MNQKVIALGFFDGVHLGHGALLRRVTERARETGASPAVVTFDRAPKSLVTGKPVSLLNSPEDRRDLIRRFYDIEDVVMLPFDQKMMTMPWQDFINVVLVKDQHAAHLVAGHDFHFGYKNQGTPELLQRSCAQLGLGCDIIPEVTLDGITVSSTHIRQLVTEGNMEEAARFLGHPHTLTGTVRHGHSIGHARLFPTANLIVPHNVLVPSHGVYATQACLADGRTFAAVTNVGTRPTVNNGTNVTVEAYLLDFSGDLYGQTLRLEYHRKLRGEIQFDSLEALKAQISQDIESTRNYFQAQ